jgi:hypothetical protein
MTSEYNRARYGNAHQIVGLAIRSGVLVVKPCEDCGKDAQAHHDDYSKPLDVRWLCVKHHSAWHDNNKPKYLPGAPAHRPRGRPSLSKADRRTKQQIFSPNEWAQVKAMAAAEGMTAAAYVRASVQRIAQGS